LSFADDPLPSADDPSPFADDPLPSADDPSPFADDPSLSADDPLPLADDPKWPSDALSPRTPTRARPAPGHPRRVSACFGLGWSRSGHPRVCW